MPVSYILGMTVNRGQRYHVQPCLTLALRKFNLVKNCCDMPKNKCTISVFFRQESHVKTSYLTVLITLIMMNVKPTVALPDSTVLNHATTVSTQILQSYGGGSQGASTIANGQLQSLRDPSVPVLVVAEVSSPYTQLS